MKFYNSDLKKKKTILYKLLIVVSISIQKTFIFKLKYRQINKKKNDSIL